MCGWAGDREDFRSMQPLLAPSLLLLGFDLSGVGATLPRDTTLEKTGLLPRNRLNTGGVFNTAEKVMVEQAQEKRKEKKEKK